MRVLQSACQTAAEAIKHHGSIHVPMTDHEGCLLDAGHAHVTA